MKKYVMFVAAIFMFNVAILAQDQAPVNDWKGEKKEFKKGERPMMTPEKRAEKLAKALDLNNSQKADVLSLFEKQDAKRHQQMERIEKMRNEMKERFEAERKMNDEALAKIIGHEKFEKFQTMRAERQEKMKEKREMHENYSTESDNK